MSKTELNLEMYYKEVSIDDAVRMLREHQERGATHAVLKIRWRSAKKQPQMKVKVVK